jgi:hypothetical protein
MIKKFKIFELNDLDPYGEENWGPDVEFNSWKDYWDLLIKDAGILSKKNWKTEEGTIFFETIKSYFDMNSAWGIIKFTLEEERNGNIKLIQWKNYYGHPINSINLVERTRKEFWEKLRRLAIGENIHE